MAHVGLERVPLHSDSWLIRFVRTEEYVTTEEIVLRCTSFALQLLLLIYVRDTIRKTKDYYSERNTCLANYSILITNIPRQAGVDKKVKIT